MPLVMFTRVSSEDAYTHTNGTLSDFDLLTPSQRLMKVSKEAWQVGKDKIGDGYYTGPAHVVEEEKRGDYFYFYKASYIVVIP